VQALVVDDEPLARRRLIALLADEKDVEIIGEAGSGSAAVEAISGKRPDLVFLDVQMPGLDGFGVLRCTLGAHAPAVIFVTAYDEHAIRAFEVQAVDYLVKPVSPARLHQAVSRGVSRVRSTTTQDNARSLDRLLASVAEPEPQGPRISLKRDGAVVFVSIADIEWVQADGDHLAIHTTREAFSIRETLSEFHGRLPAEQFARIHRSVVVNVARVQEIRSVAKGGYLVVMRDGTQLRSGRRHREAVQRLLDR
jgi:two-component system LytT family response regulator